MVGYDYKYKKQSYKDSSKGPASNKPFTAFLVVLALGLLVNGVILLNL